MGLKHPITRALVFDRGVWKEMRVTRPTVRLDAIRRAVKAIGAPPRSTVEATATLLSLSDADASWRMYDHGLAVERIPDAIAHTVELIVQDLRKRARK
jgi:hypothetical protein